MIKNSDAQIHLVVKPLEAEEQSYPDELVEMPEFPPLGPIIQVQSTVQRRRAKNYKLFCSRLQLCKEMAEVAVETQNVPWFTLSVIGFVATVSFSTLQATYTEARQLGGAVIQVIRSR